MTSIASQANSLHPHAAIVSRLLHCHSRLVPFVDWLAEPGSNRLPPQILRNPNLSATIEDLVNAISADAAVWERRQLSNAAEWIAALGTLLHSNAAIQQLGTTPRTMASVLLPLYRSLATGRLAECSAAMRLRMAEHLIVLALLEELGAEFNDWLTSQLSRNKAPCQAIAEELGQDLTTIAELLLDAAAEFDGETSRLNSTGAEILRSHLPGQPASAPATEKSEGWAHPQLLWKLAGELIATRSEIVLPRPWIDIPVPWARIQEHWHLISHQLATLPSGRFPATDESGDAPSAESHRASGYGSSTARRHAEETSDSQTVLDLKDLMSTVSSAISEDAAKERNRNLGSNSDDSNGAGARLDAASQQQQPHASLANANGERELDDAESSECELPFPNSFASIPPAECLPKVMIAEISTINDPAFSNVMRRRLAACRADDRPLCVSIIVVTPDDPRAAHGFGPSESGLSRWQQALVNWMAEQPHVADPFAFVTSDGELILCVHDIEKNEMTTQVRNALLRVLAGQNENNDVQLSKVNVPARFHAGIAATSSPGANLTVEQLVAPALRCLQAAQQQGRTGIKSIEVY